MQNTKNSAKKILCFFVAILLITFTVSACNTDPANTSSSGQGAQISKTESSEESSIISETESVLESSDQTSEESTFVPPEVEPTVVTETNDEAPDGYKSVRITFMDYNPINVDMVVPENWTLKAKNDSLNADFGEGYCRKVEAFVGDKKVADIYDSIFSLEYGDNYTMIYTYIKMGHIRWLDEYREISNDGKSAAAVTNVLGWWNVTDDDEDLLAYYPNLTKSEDGLTYVMSLDAVLSYNKDVLKYVGMSVEQDLLSTEALELIAKSIVLTAAD